MNLAAVCGLLCAALATVPPPPALDGPRVAGLSVEGAWTPGPGSPPACVTPAEGTAVLALDCPFASHDERRVYWDCGVNLDLRAARGLRFEIYCADPGPIAGFTCYLRSGGAWHAAPFAVAAAGQWQTIEIDKLAATAESRPGSWGRIDRIRIAVWRGGETDTRCYLSGFGLLEPTAPILILLGEDAAERVPSEARSIRDAARRAGGLLDDAGLRAAVVSDRDLTQDHLRGIDVAVLPYNPEVPEKALNVLDGFLAKDGRLMAFYRLPAILGRRIGMEPGDYHGGEAGAFAAMVRTGRGLPGQPDRVLQASWNVRTVDFDPARARAVATWHSASGADTGKAAVVVSEKGGYMSHIMLSDDPEGKQRLLLSVLGHLSPEVWRMAAVHAHAQAGRFGPYADFDAAVQALQERGGKTLGSLKRAIEANADTQTLLNAGDYSAAYAAAEAAHTALVDAHCSAQRAMPGEHRAFWCHDALGAPPLSWDEAIARLAANGFTAILPNMLRGGVAYYPSEVLPVAPEVAKQGDQVAACLSACKKYGIACHVWKVNWNLSGATPAAFRKRMRAAGRTQVTQSGAALGQWLCPSHPENQQLEIDAMAEVVEKYDVDGIHFDYIRYPGADSCYCAGCRKRFEARLGRRVPDWPRGTPDDAWKAFRRGNITRVVAEVHRRVRALKPEVQISAAVFRNWPSDRDTIGQDWGAWCEAGYLDFVCPMDYTPHTAQFEALVRQQQRWAGDTPCYPGIGLSVWPENDRIVTLLEQIAVTRRLGTGGFTVFNYRFSEAEEILPRCGMGITRP